MLVATNPNHLWTPRWGVLRPHFEQLRLWRSAVPFKVVAAGRRSGKTELAKRKVVEAFVDSISRGRADQYLVAAPTLGQAEAIYWEDLIALIDPLWVKNISLGELVITGASGASIAVRGLDSPQRIEGIPWRGAIVDEIADCAPGTWSRHVFPALAGVGTWAWVIGVPDGNGAGQADFRNLAAMGQSGGDGKWAFFSWASADILEPEIIRQYRSAMDAQTFEQEFEAKFISGSGSAFSDFDANVHVGDVAYEESLPICWSLDFNVNPMCSGVFQIAGGKIRVLREFCLPHTDTLGACENFVAEAKKLRWSLRELRIYGDATGGARDSTSGMSDWDIIRRQMGEYEPSYFVPRKNPYQKESVNAVRLLLRSADGSSRLLIDRRCATLIGNLCDATWPGELDRFHALAWLRYAACEEGFGPVAEMGVVGFSR